MITEKRQFGFDFMFNCLKNWATASSMSTGGAGKNCGNCLETRL